MKCHHVPAIHAVLNGEMVTEKYRTWQQHLLSELIWERSVSQDYMSLQTHLWMSHFRI